MCGIYGILSLRGRPSDWRPVLERMGNAQIHRGPDDSGALFDGEIALGMRRLSIIDVSGGHQPISNENGDVSTVCNGEIYNFRELRHELEAAGHRFRTRSDTEVIVHLYEQYGDAFVNRLSGMFALALWDARKRRLLIARDRLGIKPLYLMVRPDMLAFSSELKSLLTLPGFEREMDSDAVTEYLALGYVPAPLTMFRGVEKLLPGTLVTVENGTVERSRYWRPEQAAPQSRSLDDWTQEIRHELERAVASQMVSDVPLGAFLSGGIDSSSVVALMARHSDRPVRTYSIGFDTDSGGSYYNELPYARAVAEMFGTDHHEIIVRPDVSSLLPSLIWHLDEPIADAAFLTTYLVSKFAREDVTVILSGVGGDELFGGYRRYWSEHLARRYRMIPGFLRSGLIRPIASRLPSDRHSALMNWFRLAKAFVAASELDAAGRYENFIRVFSAGDLGSILGRPVDDLSPSFHRAFETTTNPDPVGRLMEVDLTTQLPDDLLMLTDRMSMATSLECRVPLLDDRLLDLAARMPASMKVHGTRLKHALKESLRGVLPDDIIDRRKRGFGAPIGGWLKAELTGFMESLLNEQSVRTRGYFDWQVVEEMIGAHRRSRQDYTDHLLALMNFEVWCQLYVDAREPAEIAERLDRAVSA